MTAEAVASLASLTAQADVISPDLRTARSIAALAAADTEAAGPKEGQPAAAEEEAAEEAAAEEEEEAAAADGAGAPSGEALSGEALGLVARRCARLLRVRASATLAIRDGAAPRPRDPIPILSLPLPLPLTPLTPCLARCTRLGPPVRR